MNAPEKLINRGILGAIAGAGIGLVLVAICDEWITDWSDHSGFDRLQLVWAIWATIAGIVIIFSLIFGGNNLSRHNTYLATGMVTGCLVGIAATLVASRLNNDWPFVIKGPGTTFFVGLYVVGPLFTIIGGLLGRRFSMMADNKAFLKQKSNGKDASAK